MIADGSISSRCISRSPSSLIETLTILLGISCFHALSNQLILNEFPMPELPEVENVRLLLQENLRGHVVRNVQINRADVIRSRWTTSGGRHRSLLAGGSLHGFHRHGKRLALEVEDGRVLEFSLGMSGQLLVVSMNPDHVPDHAHLIWTLENPSTGQGSRLIWRDPRRFGGLWVWSGMKVMVERKWQVIGTDALEMEYESFRERIGNTRRSIKTALLDQNLIAGIGNIYADEALHRAGIRPRRMARRLKRQETEKLHHALGVILREAIEAGGSTIQSFKDPRGGEGGYQSAHAVYGRSGERCEGCGSTIRSMALNGRTTSWCPVCQK